MGAGLQEVLDKPQGQDRLSRSRTAQHHQPSRRDAPVDVRNAIELTSQGERAEIAACRRTADVGPVVHQHLGRRSPPHGQRERIIDPPLLLLTPAAGTDRLCELIGRLRQYVPVHRIRIAVNRHVTGDRPGLDRRAMHRPADLVARRVPLLNMGTRPLP
jgi:hypothetical protein